MKCQLSLLALLCCVVLSSPALARDLEAASTGEHLWLVEEDASATGDQAPRLLVRHLPDDAAFGQATTLKRSTAPGPDPLRGTLMPRGIAAGDGRLLLVMDDRRLVTLRPVWSDLLRQWMHESRSLTPLPEGCTLLSLAMGQRGPWALVRVQSAELLDELDGRQDAASAEDDQARINRLLGLPDGLADEPDEPAPGDATGEQDDEPASETGGQAQVDARPGTEPDAHAPAAPAVPAYRLITLSRGVWVSSPLPDTFAKPRYATLLVRPGDERPTMLVEWDTGSAYGAGLTRYNPVAAPANENADANPDADAAAYARPAWHEQPLSFRPSAGRPWSATLAQGQVVLLVERLRYIDTLTFDAYLLRGEQAIWIGDMAMPVADRARWAAVPWLGAAGVVTRPGPGMIDAKTGEPRPDAVAGLYAITREGKPALGDPALLPIIEKLPDRLHGKADLVIQIVTFALAMATMLMCYRQALRTEQLRLPEHLILASFTRRVIAGMIDLTPGFLIAGAIYHTSFNETLLYWPGNGVPKVLPAMRPGFAVILITLAHTTLAEFITARSLGKWVTGLYVVDLTGRPAAPSPSLLRSLLRIFDLLAPLMLVVMGITPARQRLGDILAQTIVVMHKPRPIQENPDDDGPY